MPAPTPLAPVIRVSHLTKCYGAQVVVNDLSLEVAEGETLVLLGPNGGKTTLPKTLNRFLEPDGGTIELHGRDVRQQRPGASPTRYFVGPARPTGTRPG